MIKVSKSHTVHKFEINDSRIEIEIPQDATVLTAQYQNNKLMLWVLFDLDKPTVKRTFIVKGTGHFFRDINTVEYFGTCQDSDKYVWHIF